MAAKYKRTKRTLKFLAGCTDPFVTKRILQKANQDLVKGICNAAYNVSQGEIPLSRNQKRLFARHRPVLAALTTPHISVPEKQKKIQRGGAFGAILAAVLPTLLSTVLSGVGSAIFNRKE